MRTRTSYGIEGGVMSANSWMIIGNADLAEFQPAKAWLARRGALRLFASPADLPPDEIPETLIFVQQRPGEFPSAVLDGLARRSPLVRVILFVGPWCDGELRSGRIWPAAMRVRWHAWESELSAALDYALPRSANDVERLLTASTTAPTSPAVIGVVAGHAAEADALCDAIRNDLTAAVWLPLAAPLITRGLTALLIDLDASTASEAAARSLLASRDRPAVVLCTGFMRPEERDSWLALGAAAILAKPFMLPQWEQALAAIIRIQTSSQIVAA